MNPNAWIVRGLALVVLTLCAPLHGATVGDTFVYRVVNGYNKETVGHVRKELAPATTGQAEVMSVSVDSPALGLARTDIHAPRGQWLRQPLDNHGVPVEYEFSTPLPAVPPDLTPGQAWSVRVPAKAAGAGRTRSVRIDGRVQGNQRITVPAGEFDTVRISRTIYAGDADYFITETTIFETDWYAPALGRSVRTETRSAWRDTRSGCRRAEHCDYRGDWHIFELAEAPVRRAP